MPEIQIRPVIASDIPALISLDHHYTSEYVWQMDFRAAENEIGIGFREIRLPRSVRVEYPRSPASLEHDWKERSGVLVALIENEPVAYASLMLGLAPLTTWLTDLAVLGRVRRQGIASGLVLAAEEWAAHHGTRHLLIEMQPKNYAAIHMVRKLGYDFCGYNDRYYANHDIGLFFAKLVR
jgi:ribosomal protein S18 acetylase RimI-like enzyme